MKPSELFKMIRDIPHDSYNTSGDDVQWIILVDPDEMIIRLVFEETAGEFCKSRDWINNLNFPAKVYKNQVSCIKAARGWGDAYKSCNDEIMTSLIHTVHDFPKYEVYICGWSYGGAMAVLASEDYFYRTHSKAHVITFGSSKPLYGAKTLRYVRSCVKSVQQYAHINDCVPLLPPFIGYHHLNEIRLGRGFCISKLFLPQKYHCIYDEEELYKEIECL